MTLTQYAPKRRPCKPRRFETLVLESLHSPGVPINHDFHAVQGWRLA